MIEISSKRTVKTRREHECYGCAERIGKGEQAIYVRGKEDDQHVNFHLHPDCHVTAMKRNLYQEGFAKGVIKSLSNQEDYISVAETSLPF